MLPLVVPRTPGLLAVLALCATAACATEPRVGPDPPATQPVVTRPAPGVTLVEEERDYPVRGRTVAALTRSLDAKGPGWGGHRVYGLTRWQVRWIGGTRGGDDGCVLEDTQVFVQVRIMLPAWQDAADRTHPLDREWAAFATALREHEHGHRDIGVECAREMLRALRALGASDCGQLERAAPERAREIVAAYRRRNEAYDVKTDIGATQGAAWPPGRR